MGIERSRTGHVQHVRTARIGRVGRRGGFWWLPLPGGPGHASVIPVHAFSFLFRFFFFFFFRPALPSTAVGRGGWHDSSNINFKGKRLRKDLTPLLLFYSILVLLLVLKMVRGD